MKILFISMVAFENNSSATIRNKSLIRGLCELGHDIDIMTLKPSKNNINYDGSINDINELIINSYYITHNFLYTKLAAKKENTKAIMNNQIKAGSIVKRIVGKGRCIIKQIYDKTSIFDAQKINVNKVDCIEIDYDNYDIIISSSDPKSSHLVVKRIYKKNRRCKAKWIQYWGDPMFNDITRRRDWRDGLVKYHERKLISKADRIVYVSPLTLVLQEKTFKEFAFKMDYATQSIINNESKKYVNNRENSVIKVGYFGDYSSEIRNIIPLYNAMKSTDFQLEVYGSSDLVLENTKNIFVGNRISYEETIAKEEQSDILVCICNITGTQIPGKIYYSAGYMKPIIIILDGEYKEDLRRHFKEFDRFILCENNEDSIRTAVEEAKRQIGFKKFQTTEYLTPKYMAKKVIENIKY